MTELANPGWGALAALLVLIWRIGHMTNATERLDASVARIAKDVGDVVERIRGNVGVDSAAVLAECDRLDALSEALEGLGETHGGEGGETPAAPQGEPTPETQQPQG
ncbi:MAG: hypothetical protein JO013_05560 [Alphaproteobacteria bacterium]|nr:hypothetical protein [Alphaproteobacteria bacterium]